MKEGLEHFIQKVTLGLAFEWSIEYFLMEKCQALCHMNRRVWGYETFTYPPTPSHKGHLIPVSFELNTYMKAVPNRAPCVSLSVLSYWVQRLAKPSMNICTLAFFKLLREEYPLESSLEISSVLSSSNMSIQLTRSGCFVITTLYPKIKLRLWKGKKDFKETHVP